MTYLLRGVFENISSESVPHVHQTDMATCSATLIDGLLLHRDNLKKTNISDGQNSSYKFLGSI
jgi:hypothetical protein